MRKFAYLAAIALLSTGMAVAQTTSTGQNTKANGNTTAQTNTRTTANGAAANTGAQTNARKGKKLPQTASPLPLLFVLGAGMLGLGGVEKLRSYSKV